MAGWNARDLETLAFAARTGRPMRCAVCGGEAITATVRPAHRDVILACAGCDAAGAWAYPTVKPGVASLQDALALRWAMLQRRAVPGTTLVLPCPLDGTLIPVTVVGDRPDGEITATCFYCGRAFAT